ncbi:CBS domain-containing protein [Aquabacterium olei]|uniref:CBS domain-containing protein n=1 Tax=Aquabacterium olei TaxID=1296669 RepID=A0A2U8FWK9_9BURK|nr:CBS domain-containing protein [Aquabacterium olei]AWI55188.1 CBS domain-containing protein [Aquabacterium olei]
MTQVSQAMTRGVRTIAPHDTLVAAAQAMEELDIGALPVCDGDRLVGMLTDRDIVIRAVAQSCAIEDTKVSDVMTEDTVCCFEDQSIDEVQEQMSDSQIRRVPVVDREKHLVGMLSLGDLAVKGGGRIDGTLEAISQPAEPDRSGQSQASGGAGGGSSRQQAGSSDDDVRH